jgi:gamma-glutamylcyclotransferase (GGCT)/AIG2-like uncharacterized protein YtfP
MEQFLFVYGRLQEHGALRLRILRDALQVGPAKLKGFSLYKNENHAPMIVEDANGVVAGEVVLVSEESLDRLQTLNFVRQGLFKRQRSHTGISMVNTGNLLPCYFYTWTGAIPPDANKVEGGTWKSQ